MNDRPRFPPGLPHPFSAFSAARSVVRHPCVSLAASWPVRPAGRRVREGRDCRFRSPLRPRRPAPWLAHSGRAGSSSCVLLCPPPPGLPDGPHHQRQRELLPHVQEDVPAQARAHGHQPRSPPRPRGLGPPVLTPLPQRIAAHVSSGTFLQSRQLTGRRGRGGRLWSH